MAVGCQGMLSVPWYGEMACQALLLAVGLAEVLPDVVAVVVTVVGVAMTLAIGLASFMMSLGTCGCDVVAVVVAAVDGTGSMTLTVAGVLTIMVTAVVVADAVLSGTVA